MDRQTMFRILAAVALVLGAIAFLAIPAYSKHTPAREELATCPYGASPLICGNPGGLYTTHDYSTYSNISCDTFEMNDACGPRFWLRTGAFGLGAVLAIVLLALAGPATKQSGPEMKSLLGDIHTAAPTSTNAAAQEPPKTSTTSDRPASPTPEFKACPDCAEQIRFAARKCRFCGHMFEDVTAEI